MQIPKYIKHCNPCCEVASTSPSPSYPSMMLNDPETLVLLFAVISSLLLTGHFLYKRRPSLRPPGPPGLFGVGNFFDIPKHEAWREYIRWSQHYNCE